MTLIEHILGSRSPIPCGFQSLCRFFMPGTSRAIKIEVRLGYGSHQCRKSAAIDHLIYDYVFLISPLAHAFQKMRGPMRWAIFRIVGFFWFVETLGGSSARTQESFPLPLASAALSVGFLSILELDIRAQTPYCAQAPQPT